MGDHPINLRDWQAKACVEERLSVLVVPINLPTKSASGGAIYEHPKMGGWEPTTSGGGGCFTIGKNGEKVPEPEKVAIWHRTCGTCVVVPLQAGDRLWCREVWRTPRSFNGSVDDLAREAVAAGYERPWAPVQYEADGARDNWEWADFVPGRLRTPTQLPRWASRITIVPTEVRVCRLHEFSAQLEDSDAEGVGLPECRACHGVGWINSGPDGGWQCTARGCGDAYEDQFRELWDRAHGPGAYERNPWVCIARCAVHLRNIDSMESDHG